MAARTQHIRRRGSPLVARHEAAQEAEGLERGARSVSDRGSGLYPYLVRFLEWFASRGYSPSTTSLRSDALRRFIRWADERGIPKPQDVTRPILERYRRHLYHYRKENGEPLSFATQQQRLIPLRAFFKWLARENHILSNPASELELPRVHRKLPTHILSAEDVEAVMAQTHCMATGGCVIERSWKPYTRPASADRS